MRKRIYIAGPITLGTSEEFATNLTLAFQVAAKVFSEGHTPIIPHLTCFLGMQAVAAGDQVRIEAQKDAMGCGAEPYMAVCYSLIDTCDELIRLPGKSVGADLEVAYAKKLGIDVNDWASV